MNKLEDVDASALRDALGEASSVKTAKRLMIAIAYADGERVETLSERYEIPRSTVYSWLDRFEQQSISETIEDESRPGRPAKLDAAQREQLSTDLAESPVKPGYDTSEWTPERAQRPWNDSRTREFTPQRRQAILPGERSKPSLLGTQQPQPQHRRANASDRMDVHLTCEVK